MMSGPISGLGGSSYPSPFGGNVPTYTEIVAEFNKIKYASSDVYNINIEEIDNLVAKIDVLSKSCDPRTLQQLKYLKESLEEIKLSKPTLEGLWDKISELTKKIHVINTKIHDLLRNGKYNSPEYLDLVKQSDSAKKEIFQIQDYIAAGNYRK